MQTLTNIQALIIDMDGVLWEGARALPGLKDFFKCLRNKNLPFILATNNATLTQQQYISKLEIMGVSVSPLEILTSSMATAHYLSEQTASGSNQVFVIGEQGLRLPLIEMGFTIIDSYHINAKPVDFVICGLDRSVTWDKLADALPTERGPVPGNGAILAALQSATQVNPLIIGKPEPIMYQQAIKLLKTDPEKTIAIGDRLNTDILGAVNTGIRSIMVLTGISSEDDLMSVNYQPTWIMPDIQAVTKALQTNDS
jgi:4-nitrophenyl phosphatase